MTGWQILGGLMVAAVIGPMMFFAVIRPVTELARRYGWAKIGMFIGIGVAGLTAYIVGLLLLLGRLP